VDGSQVGDADSAPLANKLGEELTFVHLVLVEGDILGFDVPGAQPLDHAEIRLCDAFVGSNVLYVIEGQNV
jgi:hypothetical protein